MRTTLLFLALLCGCGNTDKLRGDTGGDSTSDTEEEEEDFHYPSKEGWDDPGIPGWVGRTKISTTEGCWADTDGVAPGDPGCHLLNAGDDGCNTCDPAVEERIGGLCYTFTEGGESHSWLVKTNPAVDQCHFHAGGEGHPDVFDCDAYCKGTVKDAETGAMWASGTCATAPGEDCSGTPLDSAYCACSD